MTPPRAPSPTQARHTTTQTKHTLLRGVRGAVAPRPVAAALATLGLLACQHPQGSRADAGARGDVPVASPAASRAAQQHRSALEALTVRLDAEEALARRRANDWLQWETVSRLAVERARSSGDYRDYARAEQALTRAFAVAPEGSGPLLSRARLNYTLHRLARVEPDLAAVERWAVVTVDQRDLLASLRADVAFHSGRYDEARRGYTQALARARETPGLVALAQLQWKTGHFTEAEALLAEAAQRADGVSMRAWVCLVQGLMALDRGRYDQALAHYRAGLRATPNAWVLEEHAAEAQVHLGQLAEARRAYTSLVERTGDPEFMDALAEILAQQGERDAARRWVRQARQGHDARVALFPEAAAGHALAHYLRNDPAAAVPLAERNRDARPGGEAQVQLARAYLRVGRIADARAVVEATLSTPWDTAELHAVAAVAFRLSGDEARAGAERARAAAINPDIVHSLDDYLPAAQPDASAPAPSG